MKKHIVIGLTGIAVVIYYVDDCQFTKNCPPEFKIGSLRTICQNYTPQWHPQTVAVSTSASIQSQNWINTAHTDSPSAS